MLCMVRYEILNGFIKVNPLNHDGQYLIMSIFSIFASDSLT
jgi:hypothetical protein